MPEITTNSTDSYDLDWDDERPRKNVQNNTVLFPKEKIEQLRDDLFVGGSEFKATTRDEIIGIENVLVEIDKVIRWLKNSEIHNKFKSRLEPGIIFEGDPGTGKTLVSRYIASESNALFVNVRDFPITGTLFKATDIADLFKRARATYRKTKRPIVLFWDEFENGAVERSQATPEQAATVSQLTAELDGVHGKNEGILLIGCTNYIYGIDCALRRSGRMGLQIEFHAPDRHGKRLLLDYYLAMYKTAGQIDVDTLAYFFDSDATAADIEESCMEAWRFSIDRMILQAGKTPVLGQEDLIAVFLKRLVGPPTAFISLPLEDRARIAVHEAGHAIMALVYDIPLRLITVQPGKKALGRCITAELQEHIATMDEWKSQMRVAVGSIVAEQEAGVPALIGSSGDVSALNEIATNLVDSLYAGERTGLFKPQAVASQRAGRMGISPGISHETVERSDADISQLITETYVDAQKAMAKIGKKNLWAIAHAVNERVTLTGVQFAELFVEITGQAPTEFRP